MASNSCNSPIIMQDWALWAGPPGPRTSVRLLLNWLVTHQLVVEKLLSSARNEQLVHNAVLADLARLAAEVKLRERAGSTDVLEKIVAEYSATATAQQQHRKILAEHCAALAAACVALRESVAEAARFARRAGRYLELKSAQWKARKTNTRARRWMRSITFLI